MDQAKGKRYLIPRWLKIVVVMALTLFILSGCFGSNPNPESYAANSQLQGKKVKVEKVSKQKIAEPLERVAEVQASVQFSLLAKSEGVVQEVLKNRGEFVQEGDLILRLQSQDLQAQNQKMLIAVQDARDALNRAKEKAGKELSNNKVEMEYSIQKMTEKLDSITKKYNKIRNDFDVRLATRAQLEQAESEWKGASDDLAQLKRKSTLLNGTVSFPELEKVLREAQNAHDQSTQVLATLNITAPISGILTGVQMIQTGAAVKPNDVLGLIQKLDPIIIKANLPDEEAKLVRGKTELSYYLPGTKERNKVKINYLSDIMDPQTKTYELIIQVPNPDKGLKPGMKVLIQLTNSEELDVVAVPSYSIVKEGEDSFVYVLVNDTVEKRKVNMGRASDSYQELLSGVKEGELVVTSGQQQLVDKDKVQRP
ncbi:RND family efflux transporter, MFP subunit [Paenibacillus sp. 1_12]|uniref:efflux RND transporter periplasmic adaptor subunit n=1 Tax=Paenibacillus sp. 1_12 TaxID=1566278 RepID=UPI0008E77212|nr:efflux RND transporter periplasmic adaptor subunit [Paenibacillus sp. 1_12]SFL15827.1 RND family efflux transporter, MFP subunit [Paenibacillus sp. 1_12]